MSSWVAGVGARVGMGHRGLGFDSFVIPASLPLRERGPRGQSSASKDAAVHCSILLGMEPPRRQHRHGSRIIDLRIGALIPFDTMRFRRYNS
jgi:hypothetical protein